LDQEATSVTTALDAPGAPTGLRAAGLTADASRAIGAWRNDPAWAREWRAAGWDAWRTIPMPTSTTEGWRRTPLNIVDVSQVHAVAASASPVRRADDLPHAIRDLIGSGTAHAATVVQSNGTTVLAEISDEAREAGVIVCDIHEAFHRHPEFIRAHLGTLVPARWQPGMPSNAGKFEALNAAFFTGGLFIYVPDGVDTSLPVRALNWHADTDAGFFPRSLVIVGENARLVFLEEYASISAKGGAHPVFGSAVVEVFVKDGGRLDYTTIQDWSLSTAGFVTQRATLGNNAYCNWVSVNLGGMYARGTADVILNGKGTKADMLGLAFGEGTQVFDFHTLQDHQSAFTDSDQLYKTAMRDRARLVYEGLINIRPGSYGSNGYQANRNLLLDDTAKADSIPMLEISDNDVRCTHGSSVGPIDKGHVYYLMTRGLPQADAERLVVQGFFEPVIERIASEELKERVRVAVDAKIGGKGA
jgi:Fe-S cluster assembly protein SufD